MQLPDAGQRALPCVLSLSTHLSDGPEPGSRKNRKIKSLANFDPKTSIPKIVRPRVTRKAMILLFVCIASSYTSSSPCRGSLSGRPVVWDESRERNQDRRTTHRLKGYMKKKPPIRGRGREG